MGDKVIPVKVALRIRPLVNKEICEGCRECVEVVPNEQQVIIGCGTDKAFTYDYVFGQSSNQCDLYENVVVPLLEGFFNGYNATVLAYGQTGSGKTYSMGTCAAMNSDDDEEIGNGVIPKAIRELFYRIDELKEKYDFLVKISFLEIHNEEIKDLLNQNIPDDKGIAIRENTSGEIKITGLAEVKVNSVEDMASWLEKGASSRATGATAMNTRSSRSHAIFTITMEQREKTGSRDFKKAKFHLVDLAGSERAKKTQASGERLKEGININKGLLSLGNVISALGDEQRKSHAHVPYRDSKLTRLLQDSLGGNSNTVMIACVSPADSNMEETLNTLKYADRARKIKNKPVINRDPAAAELSKLRQQVQMLQLQLLEGQYIHEDGSVPTALSADVNDVLERNKQLEDENEKLTSELHTALDQKTALHEKIMLVELSKDRLQQKAVEFKEKITLRGLDISFELAEEKENIESIDMVKHLQMKVEEMNDANHELMYKSIAATSIENMEHEPSEDGQLKPEIANSSFAVQHALRKAELCKQLEELTKALTTKEELANKMVCNDSRLTEIQKQHQVTVKELEHVIDKLEQEKFKLNTALNASKSNPKSCQKDRERLRDLEAKIAELRKKQIEHQRLQKSKAEGDAKITKLDGEIRGMKQMKVKLMRQMKEESEKFRQWKLVKDKEINQLKQQGRKRQFEYKKLESVHLKQQAVLRRKTEEASAANKRLKAALSKQKEATDKRNQSTYNQNKQSESVLERMKSWLAHEVEVMVSAGEARNALKEVIDDRKTLSQEVSELKSKLQAMLDEPSNKKIYLCDGETSVPENNVASSLRKEIQTIEIDLEVRSSQIADLQRKIIDAEQGERTKYRWNNVHTMAEAKAGLRILLSWAIEAKLAQGILKKEKDDCDRTSVETGSQLEKLKTNYEGKMSSLVSIHAQEKSALQKQHEEQVATLLNQIEKQKIKTDYEENISSLVSIHTQEKSALQKQHEEQVTTLLNQIEKQNTDLETIEDLKAENANLIERLDEVSKVLLPEKRKTSLTKKRKKSKTSLNMNVCSCKGNCSNRRCKCKAGENNCSDACQCSNTTCLNRSQDDAFGFESSNTEDKPVPSPTTKSPRVTRPLQNVATKAISDSPSSSLHRSPIASPIRMASPARIASPVRTNSPKFLNPGKARGLKGLKTKSSMRRSVKHLSNNSMKKLLNTSKSTSNVFTPSKHFVGPMSSHRASPSFRF